MNNLTQSGELIWISEPEQIGENKKVTFTVAYQAGNYEKKAAFDLWNDKCDLLKSFSIKDNIDVDFNIDSIAFFESEVLSLISRLIMPESYKHFARSRDFLESSIVRTAINLFFLSIL